MPARVLIVYDSSHGLVEEMARQVASGVRAAGGTAVMEKCGAASAEDLLRYDGILLGSPCYFAGPSASMKQLLDATYPLRGKLAGKVGGAFAASEHIGGGSELTLRSLLDFCLLHGMVVQGDPEGDPFGAVALRYEGNEAMTDLSGECRRLGRRTVDLLLRLGG
ncbi:MAG: NAD(P)H-dependent oxidoreductase [Planctomycetota bacterium]